MTPHLNRLDETVLMVGHKIRFYGEILLIIPVTPSYLIDKHNISLLTLR